MPRLAPWRALPTPPRPLCTLLSGLFLPFLDALFFHLLYAHFAILLHALFLLLLHALLLPLLAALLVSLLDALVLSLLDALLPTLDGRFLVLPICRSCGRQLELPCSEVRRTPLLLLVTVRNSSTSMTALQRLVVGVVVEELAICPYEREKCDLWRYEHRSDCFLDDLDVLGGEVALDVGALCEIERLAQVEGRRRQSRNQLSEANLVCLESRRGAKVDLLPQ